MGINTSSSYALVKQQVRDKCDFVIPQRVTKWIIGSCKGGLRTN